MDFREPDRHYQPQEPVRHTPAAPPPDYRRSGGGKKFFKFLLVLILLAGAAAGAYYYRDMEAKDQNKQQAEEISTLQQQVNTLRGQVNNAQNGTDGATDAGPTQDTLKKVEEAVKAGKYTDIQNLMASKLSVILAASEGLGNRTPAQAVADMKYIDAGTDPWNFALPAADINNYQDGDYAQYFPTGSLVGKSANNYVVSFEFSDSGKIVGIFMANSADQL